MHRKEIPEEAVGVDESWQEIDREHGVGETDPQSGRSTFWRIRSRRMEQHGCDEERCGDRDGDEHAEKHVRPWVEDIAPAAWTVSAYSIPLNRRAAHILSI